MGGPGAAATPLAGGVFCKENIYIFLTKKPRKEISSRGRIKNIIMG
jgi:hypothetical protein